MSEVIASKRTGAGNNPAVYAVAAVMLGFHLGCLGVFFTGVSVPTLIVAVALYLFRGSA